MSTGMFMCTKQRRNISRNSQVTRKFVKKTRRLYNVLNAASLSNICKNLHNIFFFSTRQVKQERNLYKYTVRICFYHFDKSICPLNYTVNNERFINTSIRSEKFKLFFQYHKKIVYCTVSVYSVIFKYIFLQNLVLYVLEVY